MRKQSTVLCGIAKAIPPEWVAFLKALDAIEAKQESSDIMCCGQFKRCPMSQAIEETQAQEGSSEQDYVVSIFEGEGRILPEPVL